MGRKGGQLEDSGLLFSGFPMRPTLLYPSLPFPFILASSLPALAPYSDDSARAPTWASYLALMAQVTAPHQPQKKVHQL